MASIGVGFGSAVLRPWARCMREMCLINKEERDYA
jgi:hypothetical protein